MLILAVCIHSRTALSTSSFAYSSATRVAKRLGYVPSMIRGTPWYACLPLPDMMTTSPERSMMGRGGSYRDEEPSRNIHACPRDIDTRGREGSSLLYQHGRNDEVEWDLARLGR